MMTPEEIERRRRIFAVIQCSLISNVPKKLRLVSIDWDEKSACLFFYFDGEIEERDEETIGDVYDDFISRFPASEIKTCALELVRVDEPTLIDYKGECVFARKETYDT